MAAQQGKGSAMQQEVALPCLVDGYRSSRASLVSDEHVSTY